VDLNASSAPEGGACASELWGSGGHPARQLGASGRGSMCVQHPGATVAILEAGSARERGSVCVSAWGERWASSTAARCRWEGSVCVQHLGATVASHDVRSETWLEACRGSDYPRMKSPLRRSWSEWTPCWQRRSIVGTGNFGRSRSRKGSSDRAPATPLLKFGALASKSGRVRSAHRDRLLGWRERTPNRQTPPSRLPGLVFPRSRPPAASQAKSSNSCGVGPPVSLQVPDRF
jgi:hypothetical protein